MITYIASAGAAISAGLLVGTTGYPRMALIGGAIALLAGVLVIVFRRVAAIPRDLCAPFHTEAQSLLVEFYAYTEKMPNHARIPRDQLLTLGPRHMSMIAMSGILPV